MEAFISGLGKLNKSGKSTSAVFKALGLSDQRLMRALLSTASAGDLLTKSVDRGNTAWRQNTALTTEAEKRYKTSAAQMKVAWNSVKDAAIDVGETALPAVTKLANAIGGAARAFADMPQPVKSATGGVPLAFTAVAGGAIWAVSKLVNGVAGARKALSDMGVSFGGLNGKMLAMRAGRPGRGRHLGFASSIEHTHGLSALGKYLAGRLWDCSLARSARPSAAPRVPWRPLLLLPTDSGSHSRE